MQGNGRERNRKGPPHHLLPPVHPGKSCARCKEQDRGWLLLPKEPSAPFLPFSPPPLAVCSRPHTPSFPCLVGTEGGGRPYAQVRRILQQTLLMVQVDMVVGSTGPSEVCAQLGCNDAGPAMHPKSASASQFVHPPTQRPNGRDGERSRETDWERAIPHHGMP